MTTCPDCRYNPCQCETAESLKSDLRQSILESRVQALLMGKVQQERDGLLARVAELEQANTILDAACVKALSERDRYREALTNISISHSIAEAWEIAHDARFPKWYSVNPERGKDE